MKKFVALMFVSSLIGSLQARDLEINVALAENQTNFDWSNDQIRLEVVASLCDECCKEVEVAVYDVHNNELIAKPCLRMRSGEIAEVCIRSSNKDHEESIKVTVESIESEESCVNVSIQE